MYYKFEIQPNLNSYQALACSLSGALYTSDHAFDIDTFYDTTGKKRLDTAKSEIWPYENLRDKKQNAVMKIREIFQDFGFLEAAKFGTHLALAEAPGAMATYLLDKQIVQRVIGVSRQGEGFLEWSPELRNRKNVQLISGDLITTLTQLSDENDLEEKILAAIRMKNVDYVDLVTADGGGELRPKEFQYFALMLAETYIAFKHLKKDGVFLLKVYNTKSVWWGHLMFLIVKYFKKVSIVKGFYSNMLNEERYIVAEGYLKIDKLQQVKEQLIKLHKAIRSQEDILNQMSKPWMQESDRKQIQHQFENYVMGLIPEQGISFPPELRSFMINQNDRSLQLQQEGAVLLAANIEGDFSKNETLKHYEPVPKRVLQYLKTT